jgi:hypothetical protein
MVTNHLLSAAENDQRHKNRSLAAPVETIFQSKSLPLFSVQDLLTPTAEICYKIRPSMLQTHIDTKHHQHEDITVGSFGV